jgi:uncharacterized membrane protein
MSLRQTRRQPTHPALRKDARERRERFESRLADTVTQFAGSMNFVYVHIIWFGLWVLLPIEDYPFGLLTMIVSLEAIFLSTFILISQNRADEKRQVVADHQWDLVQSRDVQIQQMLAMSEQTLKLTEGIYDVTAAQKGRAPSD